MTAPLTPTPEAVEAAHAYFNNLPRGPILDDLARQFDSFAAARTAALEAEAARLREALKFTLDLIHDDLTHARQNDFAAELSEASAALTEART